MDEKRTPQKPATAQPETAGSTWNITKEVLRREYGSYQRRSESFATNCYSSDYIAKRMKLSHHLKYRQGPVRVVNFNSRGDLLCAGCSYKSNNEGISNTIGIIDWASNKLKVAVNAETGAKISDVHFLNAKNYEDQSRVISAYENGHVRCDGLTPSGVVETLQSYQLSNERHRLALCPGTQHEVLSGSLSGKIFHIDLRCDQQLTSSTKVLAQTVATGTAVTLQSISHHPLAPQICAAYDDYYVRTFDKRKFDRPLHEIFPESLKLFKKTPKICDCFYNYDGSEILAIFTDTEIYLLDSENKKPGEVKRTFRQMGYLAGFTNKTSFFGPKSEYVVVGDDGQRIAFIDKVSGKYIATTSLWPRIADGRWCSVYFNDLKPHPHLPVMVAAAQFFSILSPTSVNSARLTPRIVKNYEPVKTVLHHT